MASPMEESDSESLTETHHGGKPPQPSSDFDSEPDSDDLLGEDLLHDNLQKALTDNPSDYDAHVNYITFLRKYCHVDRLRPAREAMSELFPLTPTMWQQWAKDEARLASPEEAFDVIVGIYERGVHDYISVPLWCDYLDFVQENDQLVCECLPVGVSKMRDLFERGVTAVGLHVTEGSRIWDAYVEFEQNVLDAIDDDQTEEREKQVQRIRSIFHRQLSVPLFDSGSTLQAYKSWEMEQGGMLETTSSDSDGIPTRVSMSYKKAVAMYDARADYEKQLLKRGTPEEKLQRFMTYLKFEKSFGDPARVQILYERAVTEFPVTVELWMDYTRYLDETLKVGNVVLDVYSRATRNCPWVGELWVRYLLSLERAHSSEEKLSSVFEKSLQCLFCSYEEYLDIYLTRIDGLRRKICKAASSDVSMDYSVIRDIFQRATDFLSPYLKNTDALLRLHAYWANLELKYGKDLAAVRGVWERLLTISDSMLEAWNKYIAMEIQMGHIDEARHIYERCYIKEFAGTGSEDICHSWVRFERDFGTLEDYDCAVRKVTARLEELQLLGSQQQLESDLAPVAQKDDLVVKKAPKKKKKGARSTDEQPPLKKQKTTAQEPVRSLEKEASQARDEVGSDDMKVDKPVDTNEQRIIPSASREIYTDQCTVFLSNLNLKVTDETLHEFFSDVGGVTAIRLLRDKFTKKSRGLAYIDFKDDEHLTAAFRKNKKMLMGKKVSIVRSDPKHKRRESSEKGTGEHDKRGPAGASGGSGEQHEKAVQLKGNNTFAVPRSVVKPLGWSKITRNENYIEDAPKSNDEFRKLLVKGQGSK